MRVYVFIEHYPNPYKPWVDTQLIAMLRAGHDVRVFSEASYTSTINDEILEFKLLERASYYPSTLKTLPQHLLAALRALFADPIVQTRRAITAARGSRSMKLGQLAAVRALCLPTLRPDVCYIHNLVTASRLTMLRRLYPQSRLCLYFHGGEVGGQMKINAEAEIFDAMDAVATNTRFSAAQAVTRGCAPDKIARIPVGFDLRQYQPGPHRLYRPNGLVRFISVGRMSPEKGFMHALDAVARLLAAGHRNFEYRLIGTGIQYAELQRFAREHHLEGTVHFLGQKTRREVEKELEQADAIVVPSIVTPLWAETQATVVQEALLMGCLTITTLAGGVPESNAPEMRRFAVPPADGAALADAMRDVLGIDADAMARLGETGRTFAREGYDVDRLMARILAHATDRGRDEDSIRFGPEHTDEQATPS